MTPQEREQLTHFLQQLREANVAEKNAEADTLIRETFAKQPDAAYLLVLRAMLVEQALNTAKDQIIQLRSQLQEAQSGNRQTGFLGGSNPWAQSLTGDSGSAGVPGAGNYQLPRGASPAYAAPSAPASGALGGAGSFLGSVATTAAGVVAGSFLFQGIENLLGHHHSASSLSGDTGGEHVTEQTVINNYYDTPGESELANNGDWAQADDVGDFLASDDSDAIFDESDDSDWV